MSDARPHVLIVYVDEMRGDCMSAMGHPDLDTPNLDRLAAEGALFEQAYTCYPLCTPARGAFMTGRYPHANGVSGNHKPIGPNPVLLGQSLKDAGYETCYIGKLHLAGAHTPGYVAPEYRCGFEEFVGFNHGHDYFHSIQYREEDKPLHDAGFQPDIQTDLALEFLERPHDQRPFCLFLSIGTPHAPCITPARYASLFDPDKLTLYPGTDEAGSCDQGPYGRVPTREWIAAYYRQIINIDENVGRMMDKLDKRSLSENTLVVFTSDHGDMCGQHGHFGKTRMHYGATRVPLIARWPGGIPPGMRIQSLVDSSVDTLPSISEACGIAIHPEIQGISYLPAAQGTAQRSRDAVFYEMIEWHGRETDPYLPRRGIRTEQYVYLRQEDSQAGDPSHALGPLLYDRATDPHELTNLLETGGYEAIRRELDAGIERHMSATQDDWSIFAGDWPPPGADSCERAKELLKVASPDPVLARWSGRVDRSADMEGVDLP